MFRRGPFLTTGPAHSRAGEEQQSHGPGAKPKPPVARQFLRRYPQNGQGRSSRTGRRRRHHQGASHRKPVGDARRDDSNCSGGIRIFRKNIIERSGRKPADPGTHVPVPDGDAFNEVSEAGFLQDAPRSEEHTSELQSRLHLVCRLLLEKKNNLSAHPHSRTTNNLLCRTFFNSHTKQNLCYAALTHPCALPLTHALAVCLVESNSPLSAH